jgi:putrescine importer
MSTKSAMPTGPVADEPATPAAATLLRRDAIGLPGAMLLGVVIMAPSLAIFFNWGFMVPSVGRGTAVIFAIALVMSLPTAYSYVLLNRQMPTAGATYKWASRLIGARFGIAMGLCTTLYYALFVPTEVPFIALVGRDLARSTSSTVFAVLMAVSLLAAIPLVYRGINFNIDASIILVSVEVLIVTVIAVGAFIASKDSRASLEPLNPGQIPSTKLLIPALVLGIGSFTGYDAVSTVAEETRMARRLIPKATILSVLVVGAFWLVISTILSDALPPSAYTKVISEGGFPLAAAAGTAFGSAGRDVIDIMGIEAGFALLIACSIGSTRILYAMGRDGVLDRRFGTVHPRFQVPWFAISVVLVFAVIVEVLLSIYLGTNFNLTLWLVNLIVFFALVTYLVINVCNPLLFFRHARHSFHWFSNGVVPVAGILVTGWFMYKGFFQVLWDGNFKMGRSIVITAVVLLVCTGIAAWFIARRPAIRAAARGADFDGAIENEEVLVD